MTMYCKNQQVRIIKDKVQVDPFYPRQEPQNLFSFMSIIWTDPSEQRGEMEGKDSNFPLWLGAEYFIIEPIGAEVSRGNTMAPSIQ